MMGLPPISSQQKAANLFAQFPEHKGRDSNLSSAQKYDQSTKAIEASLQERGMDRSSLIKHRRPSKKPKAIFQVKSDKTALTIVGAGTAIGGAGGAISSRVFKPSSPPPPGLRYRAPAKERSPSSSQTLKACVAGAVIAGVGVTFATNSYRKLGREVRRDILRTYNNIAVDEVDREALQESVDRIFTKKQGSWFNKIFEYYNPNPIAYLFLIKGIVLDSGGYFNDAQQQYQIALQHNIDPELQNIIYFTLARSFRLSGPNPRALEQINRISEDSPVREIGRIESEAMEREIDEVFDPDDNTPFSFKCPITQESMLEPAYYEIDARRFYFEYGPIRHWVENHNNCPVTRRELRVDQLILDDRFAAAIRIWNQTKLKQVQ